MTLLFALSRHHSGGVSHVAQRQTHRKPAMTVGGAGHRTVWLTIRRWEMPRPKTPPSVAWLCSKCRQVIRTYVRLSEPPICSGGGKHTPQKMEALDGK